MSKANLDGASAVFIAALENQDIAALRLVPKSDLHNHAMLGGSLAAYQEFCAAPLPPPPEFFDFQDFDQYIIVDLMRHLEGQPLTQWRAHFLQLFTLTLRAARSNGVTLLEPSLDCSFLNLWEGDLAGLVADFQAVIDREAGPMTVRPELGMSRQLRPEQIASLARPCLESGWFRSIDLYSDERCGDLGDFIGIYRQAGQLGLRKKAHAGELRDAAFVRESVERLELDTVQHGIAAGDSPEVMRWLAGRQIPLNVCPTSNIKLKRAADYHSHPLRRLIDHGVRVTLASDDALVFGSEISDEYLQLFRTGHFAAAELDRIRLNGLEQLS